MTDKADHSTGAHRGGAGRSFMIAGAVTGSMIIALLFPTHGRWALPALLALFFTALFILLQLADHSNPERLNKYTAVIAIFLTFAVYMSTRIETTDLEKSKKNSSPIISQADPLPWIAPMVALRPFGRPDGFQVERTASREPTGSAELLRYPTPKNSSTLAAGSSSNADFWDQNPHHTNSPIHINDAGEIVPSNGESIPTIDIPNAMITPLTSDNPLAQASPPTAEMSVKGSATSSCSHAGSICVSQSQSQSQIIIQRTP